MHMAGQSTINFIDNDGEGKAMGIPRYDRASVVRRIEERRGALGISRDGLARRAGMTPVAVERVLGAHRDMTLREAAGVARALGVTVAWLAKG